MKYVALLRGVNVGGKGTVNMAQLRECLSTAGLKHVKTYINSGNVVFESTDQNLTSLEELILKAIVKKFGFAVPVLVLSQPQLQKIIDNVPADWESDKSWKYNLVFLMPPYEMKQVTADVGELKPDIEASVPGDGVLYQSMSIKLFGRTTAGKLIGKPVYKQMTIRTTGTARKLLQLMKDA